MAVLVRTAGAGAHKEALRRAAEAEAAHSRPEGTVVPARMGAVHKAAEAGTARSQRADTEVPDRMAGAHKEAEVGVAARTASARSEKNCFWPLRFLLDQPEIWLELSGRSLCQLEKPNTYD
jgi:hypothetical protein